MGGNIDCRTREFFWSIDTSIVRNCGSSRCGSSLIITPKINDGANIFLSTELHEPSEPIRNEEPQSMNVNFNTLYNLIIQKSTRTTIGDEGEEDIHITGNFLDNIKYYANAVFGDDDDKKLAFKLIVSAFIVELLKKPENIQHYHYILLFSKIFIIIYSYLLVILSVLLLLVKNCNSHYKSLF